MVYCHGLGHWLQIRGKAKLKSGKKRAAAPTRSKNKEGSPAVSRRDCPPCFSNADDAALRFPPALQNHAA